MGMYGDKGWTAKRGVKKILASNMWDSTNLEDPEFEGYEQFKGVTGETAERLLDVLPKENRRDRQNDGPECGELLGLAASWPDTIRVDGYVIGGGRFDERVTVDCLRFRTVKGHTDLRWHWPDESEAGMWYTLKTLLGLRTEQGVPEEVRFDTGSDGFIECTMWWD